MNRSTNLSQLIKIALMGVIGFLIMFLEFAVPLFPGFLKIDLSDIPALITGFALGPVAGIGVELIKNLLHLFRTTTAGVGELANFIVGCAYVVPAALIYRRNKTKRTAVIGTLVGTVSMAVFGAIANYAFILPFYAKIMPLEAIIEFAAAANKAIVDIKTLILYGIIPFNLFKGLVLAIITFPIYKKVSKVLHQTSR